MRLIASRINRGRSAPRARVRRSWKRERDANPEKFIRELTQTSCSDEGKKKKDRARSNVVYAPPARYAHRRERKFCFTGYLSPGRIARLQRYDLDLATRCLGVTAGRIRVRGVAVYISTARIVRTEETQSANLTPSLSLYRAPPPPLLQLSRHEVGENCEEYAVL